MSGLSLRPYPVGRLHKASEGIWVQRLSDVIAALIEGPAFGYPLLNLLPECINDGCGGVVIVNVGLHHINTGKRTLNKGPFSRKP